MESKRGRKPAFGRALTSAQKIKALRKRHELLNEAMDRHGYARALVYLDQQQVEVLTLIADTLAIEGVGIGNPVELSEFLWVVLRQYIRAEVARIDQGTTNQHSLKILSLAEVLPNLSLHSFAKIEASLSYQEWAGREFAQQHEQECDYKNQEDTK